MSFKQSGLSVLAYANGFTLYHYTTVDTAAEVDTEGYFNSASSQLRVGDRIMASADTDGTAAYGDFVVLSNSGGVVDVGDMNAVGTTDTD